MSFLDGLLAAATGATGEYVRQNREQQDADRKALEREALFEQVKREKQWALDFDLENAAKKAETTAMAEAGANQKVWNDPTQVAMRAAKAKEEIDNSLNGKRAQIEFEKSPEYQAAVALQIKNGASKVAAEEAVRNQYRMKEIGAQQQLGRMEYADRKEQRAQAERDRDSGLLALDGYLKAATPEDKSRFLVPMIKGGITPPRTDDAKDDGVKTYKIPNPDKQGAMMHPTIDVTGRYDRKSNSVVPVGVGGDGANKAPDPMALYKQKAEQRVAETMQKYGVDAATAISILKGEKAPPIRK